MKRTLNLTLRRGLAVLTAFAVSGVAPLALQAQTVLNNPPVAPIDILVFPQRDFVSASGYNADDRVIVKLIHPNGVTWSTGTLADSATWITPQDDPRAAAGAPFAGIVEVNHPGGACWAGTTPDIRPGDRVQIDIVGGPRANVRSDATVVANVTAQRPVQTAPDTVVIHGTAALPDGTQIPVGQLEQRLVANRDAFNKNGRRTLRAAAAAGSDGLLAYDGVTPTSWTATYTGLDAADVARALGAESRVLWLGTAVAPAAATEGTIYEIGAAVVPGPAAPCTAPLEKLPPPPGSELIAPSTPTGLTAAVTNSNTVTLTWNPSTDNIGVTSYGVYRDGGDGIPLPIFNVQNPDGSAPAPTSFVDLNVPPGKYTYNVDAADAVGNRSALSNSAPATTGLQGIPTLPAGTVVNEPPVAPVQIIGFPSRDFVSSSGFLASDLVDVQVIRKGPDGLLKLVSTSAALVPQPDGRAAPTAPFAGIVEVNHPGGGCWDGVTPELRAGDIIRTIAYNNGAIRTVDQTTVSNVTANRPTSPSAGVVQITGTAMDANGKPLPIDQIEQRLIANRDAFDLNHRRTLRAGGAGIDGVLAYDTTENPLGIKWTARYTGLSADDVARSIGGPSPTGKTFAGAESRILWLGSQPLAGLELTIFENSDLTIPGPAAAVCFAPLEPADIAPPSAPSLYMNRQLGSDGKPVDDNVTLTWSTSTDDWSVSRYEVALDGTSVASLPSSATTYYFQHVPFGSHTFTVVAVDNASPRDVTQAAQVDQLFKGTGKPYGNRTPSNGVSVTQADVTAPSKPVNLTAKTNSSYVELHWTASTDNVAVVAYGVYRNSTKIADVPADGNPGYNDTTAVTAVGTYIYTVDAVDAAGNRSAQSQAVTAQVVAVADTVAPSVPAGVTAVTSSAVGTPDIHGNTVVVSWTASTDNVGVTAYRVYRTATVPVTTTTPRTLIATIPAPSGSAVKYTDANLPAGTYSYTVSAGDSAGNFSAASADAPGAQAVVANDPPPSPHSLIAFPARDFISATGYTPGELYTFTLIRNGVTFTSAAKAADGTGVIEVNHPGGTCWNINTPDMRPGDVIRITDSKGVSDQTTVANVTDERPIATNANTIVIHGTAQDAGGNPIPIDQLDQRLIANRDLFEFNGRRTMRAAAGGEGTMAYDAPGSIHWTATYTGLSATDMVRALGGTTSAGAVFVGAESRVLWLGRAPLALTESTIFENGSGVAGGPAGPACTAPAETPVAAVSFTPATIGPINTRFKPTPETSAPVPVTFSNGGGAPLTLTNIYIAGLNAGDFKTTPTGSTCPNSFPATLAPGASCVVNVLFSPTAVGFRQAALSFTDNAANTTDQSIPLSGYGTDDATPVVTLSATSLTFATVNGAASEKKSITLTNSSTGNSLVVSSFTVSGAAAADYSVAVTCTAPATNQSGVLTLPADQNGSCNIDVTFKPGGLGTRSAQVTLSHNPAGPTSATSTAIPLSGTGAGAVLSFNNNPVQFGTIKPNATNDQTITVKNSGNQAATFGPNPFTVTGPQYSFRSTTCGATLAVNNTCNVVVRLTTPNSTGTFTGALSVSATNGLPTTVTTNLTGGAK